MEENLMNMPEDWDGTEGEFNEIVERAFDEIIAGVRGGYSDARHQMENGKYEEALELFAKLMEEAAQFPLSEDYVWTDFHSFLDGMVYQDYFVEEIAGREIRRHPLQPGKMLFTYGSLLIETGRADEALVPLKFLVSLDPVCPKYLFELGEAYKRTGDFQEAYGIAKEALLFASNEKELARCYRDMGFCLSEMGDPENAAALYLLSLRFDDTKQAKTELAWLSQNFAISLYDYKEEEIGRRCEELDIPTGISEVVRNNLELLAMLNRSGDDYAGSRGNAAEIKEEE